MLHAYHLFHPILVKPWLFFRLYSLIVPPVCSYTSTYGHNALWLVSLELLWLQASNEVLRLCRYYNQPPWLFCYFCLNNSQKHCTHTIPYNTWKHVFVHFLLHNLPMISVYCSCGTDERCLIWIIFPSRWSTLRTCFLKFDLSQHPTIADTWWTNWSQLHRFKYTQ